MRKHSIPAALMMLLPALALAQQRPNLKTTIDEAPIAKIPADRTSDFHLLTNQDISRVAIIDRFENGHWYIDVNDLIWEFYEELDPVSLQFSPDGKKLALFAKREGKWYLVCENKEVRELGTEPPAALLFSQNSAHLACVQTLENKRQQLIVDDKVIAEYANIGHVAFSADGSHVCYTVKDGAKITIFRDKKAAATSYADEVSQLIFSADGEHVTYALLRTFNGLGSVTVLTDEEVAKSYKANPDANQVTLSPNGKHVAWAQGNAGRAALVVDGESKTLDENSLSNLVFSRDGQHLACVGQGPDHASSTPALLKTLIIDGDDINYYPKILGAPSFATDGRTVRCDDPSNRTVFFDGKSWTLDNDTVSPDGNIGVSAAHGGVVTVNRIATGYDTLHDVRFAETGKAYLLVESPRNVHVNEKILNQLTRITVTTGP